MKMASLGNLIVAIYFPLVSGLCSTCLQERCYDNGECIIGCVTGYVGTYCHIICPTRCVNNKCYIDRIKGTVTCLDGCEAGYCGAKCTRTCDEGCRTCNQQCGSCNVTLCPERRYGADCSQICSAKFDKCDGETGQCIICNRGYFGDECTRECLDCFTREDDLEDNCLSGCQKCQSEETCPVGFHGDLCELKCSTGCEEQKGCNRGTGECSNGCVSGYHGLTCNNTCNEFCEGGICNQHNGICTSGCISGYKTDINICVKNNNEESRMTVGIVVTIVTVCIVAASIMAVVIVRRRRSRSSKPRSERWENDPENLEHLLGTPVPAETSTNERLSCQKVATNARADIETFFKAVTQGKLVEVKRLLSSGVVDVNCRDKEGRTPVMIAAQYRQGAIFDFLVQSNCDVSAVSDTSNNVLHYACLGGSEYIVKMLLDKHKLDIECRGRFGRTPLMCAVEKGHMSVVEILMEKEADFNTVDDDNNNILHRACVGGHVGMVQYVLSLNITDIECRGQFGRTPLMCAVKKGHMSVVEMLEKKGADFNTVDDYKNNILHVACVGGHVGMVQYVLSLNITDIECRGGFGRTPLMMAVYNGHMSVVEMLEKIGADFNTVDDDNNNILHMACFGGHVDMVQYVLSLNITDIECRGQFGRTPLMCAVKKGHMSVVEMLEKKGADFNTVDDYKNNILHVACVGGHVGMVQYVLSLNITDIECRGGFGRTPLMMAVYNGHMSVVEMLEKKGADFNTVDDYKNNILHVACVGGHVDMVQYVLSLNITDIECRGQFGRTPLMKAVYNGHMSVVEMLEKKGADFNTVDDYKNNILHMACVGGHVDMVQYVLSLNITDIKCRGQFGRTPLMCAVEKGHMSVVEILKKKEADFNTVDDYKNNILHVACVGGHVDMVQYVLSLNITDIECRGKFGKTLLMKAVYNGHMSVVEMLEKKGADFNTVDDYKNNILHVACVGGHVDMVQYVLSLNITDIECRGQFGRTPLMCAVKKGHMSVVEMLEKKGADFNTVDDYKNNILHVACVGGHVGMVQYVLSLNITDIECRGGFGRTPLMTAVYNGHMSVVEMLEKIGADFNTVDDYKNNILHVACVGGHVDMVQYVLSLNITDIECRGRFGRTPLMCAVEKGHMSVVEILMEKEADFNTVDDDNNNILHRACVGGHVDMVQYVLSLNITDIECRGQFGRTPLMFAVEKGHLSVFEMLKKKGAHVKTVEDNNNNILHVACGGGHVDIVKHLVSLAELRGFERRKNKNGWTLLKVAQVKGQHDVVFFLQSRINLACKQQ